MSSSHVDHSGPGTEDQPPPGTGPPVVDRVAAFSASATEPAVPRRFVYWVLAGAAVLGLGGLGVERLFSSTGLNPAPAPAARSTPTTIAATPAPVPSGQSQELGASLPIYMDLASLRATAAPAFSLIDQSGRPSSLAGQTGKAVVLTFFNGPCDDICPVLAAEIRLADADLGPAAAKVEFVTVNTDPQALAVSGLAAAVQSGLGTLPNWQMVTGPAGTLNAVWKSYGISITVAPRTGTQAHNEAIYFVDPSGRERYRATPFANESASGIYSLPPADIARWGTGIATYAGRLAAP
jgi:cytochrome oxidase Cu insertion factor (SCO1/SenC/PrrC family)